MPDRPELRFHRCRPHDLPLPAYATPGSSGLDLAADVEGEVVIPPGARLLEYVNLFSPSLVDRFVRLFRLEGWER